MPWLLLPEITMERLIPSSKEQNQSQWRTKRISPHLCPSCFFKQLFLHCLPTGGVTPMRRSFLNSAVEIVTLSDVRQCFCCVFTSSIVAPSTAVSQCKCVLLEALCHCVTDIAVPFNLIMASVSSAQWVACWWESYCFGWLLALIPAVPPWV